MIDGDLVTVVVLDYVDAPRYASYMPGDVAGFEPSVAEALIQQRRVRRFQEVLPTTPAPSANRQPVLQASHGIRERISCSRSAKSATWWTRPRS